MLAALALLASAHATELPAWEVTPPAPSSALRLEMAGSGRNLRLIDPDGRVVPTPQALVFVGLPEAAEQYRQAERTRKRVASGIWIGASALGATSVLFAPALLSSDPALSTTMTYLVPVAIGSGFAVKYINPRRHLGAWTDEATVQRALDVQAAGYAQSSLEDRMALYEGRQIFVDFDGTVVDATRRPIRMKELMGRLDDDEVNAEYQRTRRIDKVVWISTLGAGGGLTALGAFTALVGLVTWSVGSTDSSILEVGGGMILLGGAGLGTGITGLIVSKKLHEDPAHWYDEPELRERLDAYDRGLREELALPEARRWNLEVHPVVGIGMVGLTGTF